MRPSQLTFGPFQLNPVERSLWKGTERRALAPKPFALLLYLARRPGQLATKEELLEAVWPNVHVGDGVLKTCVAELRHVLGDEPNAPRFIETVQRQGYRFISAIQVSNLPGRVTSFVGRERELREVKHLLTSSRLVTLLGPAGVGKSSLAIHIAADLLPDLPHGACWVDLVPASDPHQLCMTMATALGIRHSRPGPMIDTLATALEERRMLLVLDNCEHLIDDCAGLTERLMRVCMHIKILATSREPLSVDREVAWLVPALSVPELSAPPAALLACEAVRLFIERATESSPSFTVTDQNLSAIADICRRLDGLPLAIELAAVRVRMLAPEQIVARLNDTFGLLGMGGRTRQARHQTLARAIDWSYDRLTAKEGLVLAILSVFAGSFTLAAAESVCAGTGELDTTEILDLITRLVDGSLVTTVNQSPFSERRYRLLQTIRQYAHKKIPPHLETIVPSCYAEFFARSAEETQPYLMTSTRNECFGRLDREYDHLRAVLEWGRTDTNRRQLGLRIAAALSLYWLYRGHHSEGRIWLEAMLERNRDAPAQVRAQALCGAGALAHAQGDEETARAHLEESVALWRMTDEVTGLGFALCLYADAILRVGDLHKASSLIRESVDVLRGTSPGWPLAMALSESGIVAMHEGRLDEAASFHEEAAAIMRSTHDLPFLTIPLRNLALLACRQRQYDRAQVYCREALVILRPLEEPWFVAFTLEVAASISCLREGYVEATQLLGAAEKLRETIGLPRPKARRVEYDTIVQLLRTELTEAPFRAAWTAGRAHSRDEAIALALYPPPLDGRSSHESSQSDVTEEMFDGQHGGSNTD